MKSIWEKKKTEGSRVHLSLLLINMHRKYQYEYKSIYTQR